MANRSLLALGLLFFPHVSKASSFSNRLEVLRKRDLQSDVFCMEKSFSRSVSVQYKGTANAVTIEEVELLESAFKESFQESLDCPANSWWLDPVTTVQDNVFGETPMMLQVSSEGFALRYRVSGMHSRIPTESFRLFGDDGDVATTCTCEGPRRASFVSVFNQLVQDEQALVSVTSVEAVQENIECTSSNWSFFNTTLFVEVEMEEKPELTSQESTNLELAIRNLYNSLNSATAEECDPSFRQIEGVEYVPSTAGSSLSRRSLQETTPSGAPSVFVPEELQLRFTLEFRIMGRCLGCAPGTNLFDVIRIEQLNLEEEQQTTLDNIDCSCPMGSSSEGAPTKAEFVAGLQSPSFDTINAKIIEVIEVDRVECSPNEKEFDAFVYADCLGFPADITLDEISVMEFGLERAYNQLAQNFCDPNFRTITSSKAFLDPALRRLQPSTNNATNTTTKATPVVMFRLFFRVNGRCRGCIGQVSLFSDVITRRQLLQGQRRQRQQQQQQDHRRELQLTNGDECFCSTDASDDRAASASEFGASYNTTLARWLGLGLLENITSVVQVTEEVESTVLPAGPQPTHKEESDVPSASPTRLPTVKPTQLRKRKGKKSKKAKKKTKHHRNTKNKDKLKKGKKIYR